MPIDIIKRGKVYVDVLFDDSPKGRYWYKGGFNTKPIAELVPSVAVCLTISFIPFLHEIANFSWFIGAFLSAGCYNLLARSEKENEVAVYSAQVAVLKDRL